MARKALALVALAALAGCGGTPNRLQGSALDDYTLEFEEVRAERLMGELLVRYLFGAGRRGNEPVRITVAPEAAGVGELALAGFRVEHFWAVRQPDGTIDEEPGFPPAESGWLRLDEAGGSLGERVSGEFSVTFQDGAVLGGSFNASLSEPAP